MNDPKTAPLKRTIRLTIFVLVIHGVGQFALAQSGNNPFELTPRLGTAAAPAGESAAPPTTVSTNPFDLVAPSKDAVPPPTTKARPAKPKKTLNEASAYRRFLFVSVMTTLLLLTLLTTFLRPYFQKVYSAFSSDNMFNQVFRERESVGLLPFLLLYVLFFFNAGLFAYLLLHFYKVPVGSSHLLGWVYCTAGVTGLFFLKHLTISMIGAVFPVQKEARQYNFLIIVFAIVAGVLLVPVNVLLAYGPENLGSYVIYFALGTLTLLYLFRYLRGLIVANRFVAFHKFHFLLYICTVEIAPVLFLVKLALNQI